MLKFNCLKKLFEETEIHQNEFGDKQYTAPLHSGVKLRIKFKSMGNKRYEMGAVRVHHDENGNEVETDKFMGRTKLPLHARHAATLHTFHSVRHFIKTEQPHEIITKGNTAEKRKLYRPLMDTLKTRYPGAESRHSDNYSLLRLPPTGETAERIKSIKQSNLEKLKAANKKITA